MPSAVRIVRGHRNRCREREVRRVDRRGAAMRNRLELPLQRNDDGGVAAAIGEMRVAR